MKIGIGNDHTALSMKGLISRYLQDLGYEVVNFGTDSSESFDYPVVATRVAEAVVSGEVNRAILICGSGVGMSLAANKVTGIRAVVCSDPYSAKLSREHNDCNILCFGARVVGSELAKMIVEQWLTADFEGGRHQRRVDMIMEIEKK